MSKKKVVLSARERERRARQRAAQRQQALVETTNSGLRRIVRWPQLEAMTGRGRTAIQSDIKAGLFPRGIPLGGRARGWLIEEVDAWIQARAAERVEAAE
jgi:prophage regulatory protein